MEYQLKFKRRHQWINSCSNLLVQEPCTMQVVQDSSAPTKLSCTSFFLSKLLAPNTTQLYSVQETSMQVTKIVRSDWLSVFSAGVIYHFRCNETSGLIALYKYPYLPN